MSLRASGKHDAAYVLKDISTGSPSVVREKPLSADEALSLVIESKSSKNQYNLIRNCSLQKKCLACILLINTF